MAWLQNLRVNLWWLLGLGTLAFFGAIAVHLALFSQNSSAPVQQASLLSRQPGTQYDQPPATNRFALLPGFPAETGGKVFFNYQRIGADSSVQDERSYESGKTILENFQLFLAFLEQQGWKVTTKIENETESRLAANRGSQLLTVKLTSGSVAGGAILTVVTLQLVTMPGTNPRYGRTRQLTPEEALARKLKETK